MIGEGNMTRNLKINMRFYKNEKFRIIVFFAVLTIILTWPSAWNFFSSVPTAGADTMQVIGVAGERMNLLHEQGFFKGTYELIKQGELNVVTMYAWFFLVFGRIVGYNILFFVSFILSGFGAYLLAFYFTKNKPASLIAGIVFAFSPFHIHNSLSTNVGTMHQEWLPFFALYLFKFFEDLSFKNFSLAAMFLFLIGLTEHQLLAFTAIFILFFFVYKLIIEPKAYLRPKFWIYTGVSIVVLSVVFFVMFRSLLAIAGSENNYLDAGLKSAVNHSNDSLSIFIPPNFHSFWPGTFQNIRKQFERQADSNFSVYAGYSVLILSLVAIFGAKAMKKEKIPTRGIFFWLAVAVGFYILSWGPYLHFKGALDPPVKMPYWLVYQYLPFYKNIRTVGRLFAWSMLGFSVLAAWGIAFLRVRLQKRIQNSKFKIQNSGSDGKLESSWPTDKKTKSLYALFGLVIILEFLAVPFKTDSLRHSPFYEKLGGDKEQYNVLEVPGSTSYNFASRDLVWKSIHRKPTINGYDFARVIEDHYTFQRGTPIIRTLLYDIPEGSNGNDRDIMKDSYYKISNDILNYYNVRYVILDRRGLASDGEKGDVNMFYPAKAYIANVMKCEDTFEDEYLYACKVGKSEETGGMFLAMDYSNKHWVGKSEAKNGLQRWMESGAGVKLVNMGSAGRTGKLSFNLKISKPLRIKVFLNGKEVFNQYISSFGDKQQINVGLADIKSGENEIIFGVYGADGTEIFSENKMDTARIYQVGVE